jgi:serine/threonine-protein kinase
MLSPRQNTGKQPTARPLPSALAPSVPRPPGASRPLPAAPTVAEDIDWDDDNQPTRQAPVDVLALMTAKQTQAAAEAVTAELPTEPQSAEPAPTSSGRGWVEQPGDDLPPLDSDDDAAVEESTTDGVEPDQYVGTTLGDRYVIDKVLGEGGMGKVYRAHHKVIEKKVAVKILHAELAKDKEAVGRFLREARAASSIGNPHIIDIIDFGEAPDGSTYFVMEYLNGESLGALLDQRGKLPVNMVCDIAIQLCDGLAAAHDQQIVHRDLKPDNIVLLKPQGTFAGQSYFCKILDFGIAKVSGASVADGPKLTMAGQVFGTPHYMSPEQAAGEAIDHRTDIYSLGVMLYEMISGEMPFNADNFMGILTQHMYKPPPPLRSLPSVPDCPPALEAIILKCLSKKREARYETMLELADDIHKLRQTGASKAANELQSSGDAFSAPAAYFESDASGAVAKPKRRTFVWLAALVAAALGVGAFVISKGNNSNADPVPDSAASAATAPTTATATLAASERAVIVLPEPADAVAVLGDKRIKLPDSITVVEGKPVTVRIEAEGYESKTIELDGKEPKVKVKLDRTPGSVSAAPATSAPAAAKGAPAWKAAATGTPATKNAAKTTVTTKKSGGDVRDPW